MKFGRWYCTLRLSQFLNVSTEYQSDVKQQRQRSNSLHSPVKDLKWVNYFSPTLLKPNLKGKCWTQNTTILFITLLTTSARTVYTWMFRHRCLIDRNTVPKQYLYLFLVFGEGVFIGSYLIGSLQVGYKLDWDRVFFILVLEQNLIALASGNSFKLSVYQLLNEWMSWIFPIVPSSSI